MVDHLISICYRRLYQLVRHLFLLEICRPITPPKSRDLLLIQRESSKLRFLPEPSPSRRDKGALGGLPLVSAHSIEPYFSIVSHAD